MNRETTLHSSDTLVVVDGSRRKRWAIIGGILAALAAILIALSLIHI